MIVGIDLGTTYSAIACMRDGSPQLIPNGLDEVLTPSVTTCPNAYWPWYTFGMESERVQVERRHGSRR